MTRGIPRGTTPLRHVLGRCASTLGMIGTRRNLSPNYSAAKMKVASADATLDVDLPSAVIQYRVDLQPKVRAVHRFTVWQFGRYDIGNPQSLPIRLPVVSKLADTIYI